MEFRWLSLSFPSRFRWAIPFKSAPSTTTGSASLGPPPTSRAEPSDYLYDPNGNLVKRTDDRGTITDYTYDELNRPTTTSYTLGVERSPPPRPALLRRPDLERFILLR